MSKDGLSDHKAEYFLLNARLCRLVQQNPCMYDRSSPNYLKKDYVDRAWANISKEVNDTVPSCKERWRNIRTAYARSVNIYKSPSGPNRHKRYYLHHELQFLTKHISPSLPSIPIRILSPTELGEIHGNCQQSMDEIDESSTFQITLDSNSPPQAIPDDQNNEEEFVQNSEPAEQEPEQETEPEPERRHESMPEPESEPQTENESTTKESSCQVVKKRRRKFSDESPKQIDQDYEFLQSLLPEMKLMNARQKILFKGKIFQTLEEVFSDSRDFPHKEESLALQSSPAAHSSTGRALAKRSFGNKVFPERRDKSPRVPMVQLGHSLSSYVKQENDVLVDE